MRRRWRGLSSAGVLCSVATVLTNVFISYERGAETTARQVADLLRRRGLEVWLDADLPPNRAYADVIQEHLNAAKAVLVLWSKAGRESEWVRAEADEARTAHKLVQATLDGALPPMPFNQIHCADLKGWRGDPEAAAWVKVALAVDSMVGIAPASAPTRTTPPRRQRRPAIWIGLALTAVVVAGGALWLALGRSSGTERATTTRLAILPFRVESTAPSARFFADSLSEEIQSDLSNNQFQVVSRTDAEALAGADSAQKVEKLGVRLLFDGAVQDDGATTSVTVNIEDPRNHVTVWSSRIDGESAKSGAMRAHLAALIVSVLNCAGRALNPVDGLTDPQVLTQYLIACDRFAKSGEDHPQTMDEMVSALRQVIAKAPQFAAAHSALAKYLAYVSAVSPTDQAAAFRQEAKSEAERALALDPKDADAYVALELLEPADNWAGREALLRRGVAANPDWPHANGFLGSVLAETGRLDEAAGYFQKATAEDRPGQNWEGGEATVLVSDGRSNDADAAFDEMTKYWPDSPDDWYPRYSVRALEGRWNDALALLNVPLAARVLTPAGVLTWRDYVLAAQSRTPASTAKARRELLQLGDAGGVRLTLAIGMLSSLGDVDAAFRLAARYQPGLSLTQATTTFLFLPDTAAMRRDPRFMQLAARIGLLQFWRSTGRWPDFCREPGLPYACR
jgi:TolB-like protein